MSSAIENAIRKSIIDGDFGLPVAWSNQKYDPVDGTAFMRFAHDPLQPEAVTLSGRGEDEHRGAFMLTLYYPSGTGVATINGKADEFRTLYQAGVRFSHDGQEFAIVNCGRSSGRAVDGWWSVTVTVDYWARTTRSVA
jgi:hypothetical protein